MFGNILFLISLLFQLKIQLNEIKANKHDASRRVDKFCSDIQDVFNSVMAEFKTELKKSLTSSADSLPGLEKVVSEAQNELENCHRGSELTTPITKLSGLYNEIAKVNANISEINKVILMPLPVLSDPVEITKVRKHLRVGLQSYYNESPPFTTSNTNETSQTVFAPLTSEANGVDGTNKKRRKRGLDTLTNYNPADPSQVTLPLLVETIQKNDVTALKQLVGEHLLRRDTTFKDRVDHKVARKYVDSDCESDDENMDVGNCSLFYLSSLYDSMSIMNHIFYHSYPDLMEECFGNNVLHNLFRVEKFARHREKLAEAMLKRKPELARTKNRRNRTVLELAITAKSPRLCRLLVETYGVDVNSKFDNGYTPLLVAIDTKCEEVFQVLLDVGACLTDTGKYGMTTLHLACEVDWPFAINAILPKFEFMLKSEDGRKETPLSVALASDSVHAIETIHKCSSLRTAPVEFSSKKKFFYLATEAKAVKTLKWLETTNFFIY